jgi:hypothetical protein
MMDQEDLSLFSALSSALWADEATSRRVARDTCAAVSLMNLSRQKSVEKVASTLLDLATRNGLAENSRSNLSVPHLFVQKPFFKLSPMERFALAALHSGRWSYSQLARVMRVSEEQLQELAWKARIQLAQTKYPVGPKLSKDSCPEYLPHRPWTQKFLDEELSAGSERVFMQNHLMACDCCRGALGRCRDLYYAVEALIPAVSDDSDLRKMMAELARLQNEDSVFSGGLHLGFSQSFTQNFKRSLVVFTRRLDVQIVLGLALALIALKVFQQLR